MYVLMSHLKSKCVALGRFMYSACVCVVACVCVAPEEGGVRPAEPDFVVGLCAPREPDLGQLH